MIASDYMEEAREEVVSFAKSGQERPDEQTAKDFKVGRLSMGDLIHKLYPNNIPNTKGSLKQERTKGRRK